MLGGMSKPGVFGKRPHTNLKDFGVVRCNLKLQMVNVSDSYYVSSSMQFYIRPSGNVMIGMISMNHISGAHFFVPLSSM